ncbi:MAG TPA: heme o synthase [Candidatus Binatia bacterium]|nr:heme o synthase [Candidatus Binatia bacterium]
MSRRWVAAARDVVAVAKPGMIAANDLTAAAGCLLASRGHVGAGVLAATLGGASLIMGFACVANNYLDRRIDGAMARTRGRPFVRGTLPAPATLVAYGAGAGAGVLVLASFANLLTAAIGGLALVFYVVLYAVAKRRSSWATLVGAVPGAAPAIAGYCAVKGRIDGPALLLFAALVLWQIPHFYAIAVYRSDEYRAARLPTMLQARGMRSTRAQMVLCMGGLVGAVAALTVVGAVGVVSLGIAGIAGLGWLAVGLRGFAAPDAAAWARRVFRVSVVVLAALSVSVALGGVLP